MALPLNLPLNLMQTQWKSQIDPALSNPFLAGRLLTGVVLSNGTPTIINHGLGQKLQGWLIVGISAAATVYDNQSTNPSPQLTLSLTSNAVATANLWVF
jgi:hypothetical protein